MDREHSQHRREAPSTSCEREHEQCNLMGDEDENTDESCRLAAAHMEHMEAAR